MSNFEIAESAKKQPGIWVQVPNPSPTTANLVTRIRQGKVAAFAEPGFEARSSTGGLDSQGRKTYLVDVRYVQPESDTNLLQQEIDRLKKARAALDEAISRLEVMNL